MKEKHKPKQKHNTTAPSRSFIILIVSLVLILAIAMTTLFLLMPASPFPYEQIRTAVIATNEYIEYLVGQTETQNAINAAATATAVQRGTGK